MKIAVIGTGNIGGTLGGKWAAAGHEVVYGSRSGTGTGPGGGPVRPIADAIESAGVVVLAVPGGAVDDVLATHGAALDGKVVVDATNRIGAAEVNSRSAIAAAAPGARYVRAFSTLGWENFAEPLPSAGLFFAADPEARPVAEDLIRAVGLEPAYVGDAGAAATVDGVLPLWFALVQQHGGNRKLAFAVLT
ncbi:MAG TPA: NAD(P)-binding domain-containing protein [Streptosporangiaceae bacterium]